MTGLRDVGEESLPQTAAAAVDSGQGVIYLADQTGQRILKFLDTAYCTRNGITNPFAERLVSLNQMQKRNKNDPGPTALKAAAYEEISAFEMAKFQWEKVLDLDPFHEEAQKRIARLEIAILKTNAQSLKEKTLQVLESKGPESARRHYSRTLQLYEEILSLNPGEAGIAEEMKGLKRRFLGEEEGRC